MKQRVMQSATCYVHAASALALAVLLSACTLERPESFVPTSYDFGPPPAYKLSNPSVPGTVLIPPVRAPDWLDDSGIVYRLLYDEPTRNRIYAMSRWSTQPAALITDRLRARFAAAAKGVVTPGFSVRSDYTLRVELDDFSQHFTAPSQSRVQLRARASVLDTDERRLIAQRVFDLDLRAEPNAPGAVKALTEATDGFLEELLKWTAESVRRGAEKK